MLRIFRNLLLLEVLAITAFVGIIAAIFLNRLVYYQEAAEKANMELVISSMKSALRLKMASMMIEGRMSQYGQLTEDNPMDWLEKKPVNDTYEILPPTSSRTLAGRWVYDASHRILTYWPKHTEHLQPDSAGMHRIRLRVQLLTEALPSNNELGEVVTGARLVLVEPYKWF